MNQIIHERAQRVPLTRACLALGLNRSSVYARRKRRALNATVVAVLLAGILPEHRICQHQHAAAEAQ